MSNFIMMNIIPCYLILGRILYLFSFGCGSASIESNLGTMIVMSDPRHRNYFSSQLSLLVMQPPLHPTWARWLLGRMLYLDQHLQSLWLWWNIYNFLYRAWINEWFDSSKTRHKLDVEYDHTFLSICGDPKAWVLMAPTINH